MNSSAGGAGDVHRLFEKRIPYSNVMIIFTFALPAGSYIVLNCCVTNYSLSPLRRFLRVEFLSFTFCAT